MPTSTPTFTILKPARLMDGTDSQPKTGMAVLLQDDRIQEIGPEDKIAFPGAATGEVLEFPDATLLPGLIDCHTHTNMPGTGRRGEDVHREDTDDIRLMRSAHNVSIALQSGVTTVCDCGGWNKTTFSLKEAIKQGLVNGPRVLAAGRPITTTGGHCWFMGSEADGVDGVRQAARQLIKEGADFLKVMGTGGSTLGTDPFRPAFSMESGARRRRASSPSSPRVPRRPRRSSAASVVIQGPLPGGAALFSYPGPACPRRSLCPFASSRSSSLSSIIAHSRARPSTSSCPSRR